MTRNSPRPPGGLALALATVLLAQGCGGGPGADAYNLLLVTLDTTRADYFGCYAGLARDPVHPRAETPSFDALAAEGVRFDLGMATAAVTPVAHASILTGLFNHEHGLRVMFADGGFRLGADVPTLFTVLQEKGWRTGAFHSAFPVSDFFGLGRGFDVYETMASTMQGNASGANWEVGKAQRRSEATTDLALRFLEQGDGRFAMWVHYWDPHDTVMLPPGVSLPKAGTEEQNKRSFRDLYAAEVTYVDRQFGRLVAALKQRGVWERTIVVVVADHGEGLGDHGWWHHRVLYQEGIRVPFLVRVPGTKGGDDGTAVARLARTIDLAPTVLDYQEIAGPPMTGRSLRPLIEGSADEPRIALADQVNGFDFNAGEKLRNERPQDLHVYCAMDERWKLLYRPHDPAASELFDLAADPRELVSLYADDHPEAVRLRTELARQAPWVTRPFAPIADITEAERRAAQDTIEDLGYTAGGTSGGNWGWVCPVHLDQPTEGQKCPRCGERPIPVPKE